MASLRTLLRLHGGGRGPLVQQWTSSRQCATATIEESQNPEPVQYDVKQMQDRASRPLAKFVTPKGKSRVLRALASTWKPLVRPLAANFRAHTDPLAQDIEIEREVDRLGEEAAAFMARYHDVKFGEAFPWTDPAKPPEDLGRQLIWHVDRLHMEEADATRQLIMDTGRMTQHLENCWLDARLSWDIVSAELSRAEAIEEGRGPDAETQQLMDDDLVGQLKGSWDMVAMKDGVSFGLYSSALAHIGKPAAAMRVVETAHQACFQVPLSTYHYLLERLPNSWSKAQVHPEDSAKVEDVLSVLRLMTAGPRVLQPEALTFQKACSALHKAGMPGAAMVFSVQAEMDACKIEPTLGTYYYIFSAAMNYLDRPEVLEDIIKRLSTSSSSLVVRSEEDEHFMNLALQQLALNNSRVSSSVVTGAGKLLKLAKSMNYTCVHSRSALVDDYVRLVGSMDNCSNAIAANAVSVVEEAIEDAHYVNFHTFAVLGALGESIGAEFSADLYLRSWKAMKKQLVLQQFNVIYPAMLLQTTQLTKAAAGGAITKSIVMMRVAQLPIMDGFLEDMKLFDVLEQTCRPMHFNVRDDNVKLIDEHQKASVALLAFKKSLQNMMHNRCIPENMAVDMLHTLKEICTLHMCVGVRIVVNDIRVMAELAVHSQQSEIAITTMNAMIAMRFIPPNHILSALTHNVLQHTDEINLLGTLALVATCGIRLPIDRYKAIGTNFSRPILLTALWLGEQTSSARTGRDLTTDLLRAWPHALDTIKARRDGIDNFLLEDSATKDDSARSLKKLFEEMTVKKRVSPLDLVEKETSTDRFVDVLDASEDEDLAVPAKESSTLDKESVFIEASRTQKSEYRGEKTFAHSRHGR